MLAVCGVGLGDLGRYELSLLDDLPDVTVVGGADPDPDARAAFTDSVDAPAFRTHEALFESIRADAAVVATPHALHADHVRACLDAGLHAHVEKPFVTDAADARALVERAADAGLTLAVGYQWRFDPRYRELRRLRRAGRVGDVHMAVAHLEQEWIRHTRGTWRTDPALSGGGQLLDSGSHLLDILLWATGTTPRAVAATVDDGDAVDVNSALALELDRDGDTVTASVGVSGAGTSVPAPGASLRLWGDGGELAVDGETVRVRERGSPAYESTPETPSFDSLTREKLRNFVAAAVDGESPVAPASDAVAVVALTQAVYESAETGRRVELT